MTTRPRSTVLATACAAFMAASAQAADAGTTLTLYRSASPALFASSGDGSMSDGHAVVREQRTVTLKAGTQDLSLGDLPLYLDPEAIALSFPNGTAAVVSNACCWARATKPRWRGWSAAKSACWAAMASHWRTVRCCARGVACWSGAP